MIEPVLTKEGQKILYPILNMRPPILRERRKEKYFRILSLLMNERGVKEAGGELVMEAIGIVESKMFDPFFLMMEDPAKHKRLYSDTWVDIEAYNARPRQVRRWDTVPSKPAKRPEEMKVIAFCASPRKGGNTEVLIDEALRGAEDVGAKAEKIMLQNMNIGYCIGCRKCKEPDFESICAVKDDMSDIYQKIIDSDAIIIGFPIYTGRESAQLATFLDRWDCFARFGMKGMLEPGRRALVIGTWGAPYVDTFDHVIEWIITVINGHRVETVEAISACGFEGMLHGFDDKGKAIITKYPEELEKAYQAGKSLVTG